jgi:hypothetical protein
VSAARGSVFFGALSTFARDHRVRAMSANMPRPCPYLRALAGYLSSGQIQPRDSKVIWVARFVPKPRGKRPSTAALDDLRRKESGRQGHPVRTAVLPSRETKRLQVRQGSERGSSSQRFASRRASRRIARALAGIGRAFPGGSRACHRVKAASREASESSLRRFHPQPLTAGFGSLRG